ncbi:MAG: hypothetical protein FJ358_08210 [Thaumarchaeota archaeon]|nr:hypothetical protein [Nitrososphaerota archaeon]
MSSIVEKRLNTLVKFVGLMFLVLGAILVALTATSPVAPQVSPVFYFIAITMIVSGFVTLYAKLK